MKRLFLTWFVVAVAFIVLLALSGAFFTVAETEQIVITQFGQPVGKPITQAGLHFKIPFIQTVNRIEKRVLEWDGPSTEMPTKDKLYILVYAFGRWRISDPLEYFLRLRDERSAQSRLEDILGSEMRNTVARHPLAELIRTTNRTPIQDEVVATALGNTSILTPIEDGRLKLELEIAKSARQKLEAFGIELLDVRFKRIDYNRDVSRKIFDRMISERRQIAERFRSEGAGEAARVLGTKERDVKRIDSEAYEKVQAIQGKADGEATAIYAKAFNQTAEAREFFTFQRALEVYKVSFLRNTSLVLTTDSSLLKYFKGDFSEKVGGAPAPAGQ